MINVISYIVFVCLTIQSPRPLWPHGEFRNYSCIFNPLFCRMGSQWFIMFFGHNKSVDISELLTTDSTFSMTHSIIESPLNHRIQNWNFYLTYQSEYDVDMHIAYKIIFLNSRQPTLYKFKHVSLFVTRT